MSRISPSDRACLKRLFFAGFGRSHDRVKQAMAGDRLGEARANSLPFSDALGQPPIEWGDIAQTVTRLTNQTQTGARAAAWADSVCGGSLRQTQRRSERDSNP